MYNPSRNSANESSISPCLKGQSLALERFRFVKRMEMQLRGFSLHHSLESKHDIIFPYGKSDRLYIILWNSESWISQLQPGSNYILCYQHKDGIDKLVYKIRIRPINESNRLLTSGPRFSLFAYIYSQRTIDGQPYSFVGSISKYANNDLNSLQEFILYNYSPVTDALKVLLLSKTGEDNLYTVGLFYDLSIDPVTKDVLQPNEFYRKHGLPIAKEERHIFR